ncbi:MAG: rod shape-determining protein RodA [Chlamydiae bacterium RIFCSPLOWO2_01_FULL_28_7]|nr:MAG: rod shape-determining protein RodA [Chlamydiae bacterium RIFCSPLOWO2_01_FULL_28_7]
MLNYKYLRRIDLKMILLIFILMIISLFVISSMTETIEYSGFLTSYVKNQIQWFVLGWVVFIFFAGFDYRKLYQYTWVFYFVMIVLLLGLYIAAPIQSVHRWYRIPLIGMNVQPSEYAKLIVVMCIAWYIEKNQNSMHNFSATLMLLFFVLVPFILILKQPDLGTALVLYPITLIMLYFSNAHKKTIRVMTYLILVSIVFIGLIFSNVLPHEKMKPFFLNFLKEYQYERLNPSTYHQNASKTAIAIGGIFGTGYKKSEFAAQKWLPAAHTDSAFAAFAEQFGLFGLLILLIIFYAIVHLSFSIVLQTKDYYGRLIASGIAVYLAMHIIVNIGMMCGFLPISGVPLLLITYGGNSVLTTMAALGILQSIYSRRVRF